MSNDTPSESDLRAMFDDFGGNIAGIARHIDRPRSTVQDWYRKLGLAGTGRPGNGAKNNPTPATDDFEPMEYPTFPEDDVPVTAILDTMAKRFEKRHEYQKSKEWFKVKVNIEGPIGLTFWGDPHLDDNGCNIPLLRHHCDLHANNPALLSVNIGDTINNWTGRLAKLFAHQDTSQATAVRLAEWFLKDAGIRWAVWLMGNHDMWGEFSEVLRAKNVTRLPMEDWQARFSLVFPNERECRIWAAHDFKGHSMWNSLHGPQKAAHMKSEAHIYACGHTHNYAIHQEESASRDFTYWLVRSRGYKYIDQYAELLGHFPQQEGASITCVINPDAQSEAGFIQAFADMDAADSYLRHLRGTAAE